MHWALDGTPLLLPTGGITRYVEQLSQALAECQPQDQVCLLSDQPPHSGFQGRVQTPANLVTDMRHRKGWQRRWWLLGVQAALRQHGSHLFHGTDFHVPLWPRIPSVLTLHDLSPWRDPAWHHAAGRVRQRVPFLLLSGIATMIITPTEAVRREAISSFGLAPSRVVAVASAAAPHLRPVTLQPAKPYFLYVGTLEPRKNLHRLVQAWQVAGGADLAELWLAGRTRADFAPLPALPGLRLLGAVPDTDLLALYGQAVACVYPSLYEGFGLPVLEAMQCGAAVLASADPALCEVSGGAAWHLPADDVRAWAGAMQALCQQPHRAAELRSQSVRRASGFSWHNTARQTLAVYQEAVARFGR